MRKTLILALVATLLMTGSLFAQGRRLVAEPNATFAGGAGGAAAGPTTTNNDDSCDIGVAPAATLLLPYFAVARDRSRNTTFTLVNTVDRPQIAHVTVWTDWSFPVLDFNVFLTGYDVQPLSLHDIIFNNSIAPLPSGATGGTTATGGSTTTGTGLSPIGDLANQTNANPNFRSQAAGGIQCSNLPGQIPQNIATAVQNALINGTYIIPGTAVNCGTNLVGSPASSAAGSLHALDTAIGYVTVDVASFCSLSLPTDPSYFRNEILFDNVLTGDYQIFDSSPASNYAGGNPLVHIRAIPEGGPAATPLTGAQTNLPYTFYARYINDAPLAAGIADNYDRRQPLPHVFAARYITGGTFNTNFRIWREGITGGSGSTANPATDCDTAILNSALPLTEIVRFDEHENHTVFTVPGGVSPELTPTAVTLPEASSVPVNGDRFPPMPLQASDFGGWMYLNLDLIGSTFSIPAVPNGGPDVVLHPGFALTGRASQNWVTVSMSGSGAGAGALAVDFDATWLGNGCSAPVNISVANTGGTAIIGPAGSGVGFGATLPGTLVCPNQGNCTTNADRPATNVTP